MRILSVALLLLLSSLAVLAVPPVAAVDCIVQSNPVGVGFACDGPTAPSGADSFCAMDAFGQIWRPNQYGCAAVKPGGPGTVCVAVATSSGWTCT